MVGEVLAETSNGVEASKAHYKCRKMIKFLRQFDSDYIHEPSIICIANLGISIRVKHLFTTIYAPILLTGILIH